MARSKSKRKKKKASPLQQALSPKRYIREQARKMPIYTCLIDAEWEEKLFSPIIVARLKKNGNFIFGSYVVDMQCLGIKDTLYLPDMDKAEYTEMLESYRSKMGLNMIEIDPALCFNIIYGAVDFAEDCGFQPHKSFSISQYILDDVEELVYMEVPPGADSRPHFVAGPYDDVDKVLRTLNKHVGEGKYDFTYPMHDLDEMEFEKQEPQSLFDHDGIARKLDTMEDEAEKMALNMQVGIAHIIFSHMNGDLAGLLLLAHDDSKDDLIELVLDAVLSDDYLNLGEKKLDTASIESFEHQIEWLIEKIIEFEGPQFLWAEDYKPEFIHPTEEELEAMGEEELEQMRKDHLFYLTNAERNEYMLKSLFLILAEDYSPEQLKDSAVQEELIQHFYNELEGKVLKKDLWDEGKMELRGLAMEVIATLLANEEE